MWVKARMFFRLCILLLAAFLLQAQTRCGAAHTGSGVFICYPNPSEHVEDANLPTAFHVGAQINAPLGRKIGHYVVMIDASRVYDARLPMPQEQLSIEINVKSPFRSGSHTLRLVVDGMGMAAISGLQFHPSRKLGFCDSFGRVDPRTCLTSNFREPMEWSMAHQPEKTSYLDYVRLYSHNLESIEADVADAVAVDSRGYLYAISHSFADIEVRKYAQNGSLVYDNLIRSCGSGFVSISGIAVVNDGRLWIAGNSSACFRSTQNALLAKVREPGLVHGFVILIDTNQVASLPLYATYLADVENRIAALRVDSKGNAYIGGTTTSMQFPHDSVLKAGETARGTHDTQLGFVSALNWSGTALLWSTLLPATQVNALAIDGAGTVYITGRRISQRMRRGPDDLLIAALSDDGRRILYEAQARGLGIAEGRAISTSTNSEWVLVTGDMGGAKPFLVAFEPCRSGKINWAMLDTAVAASPGIAVQPALEAFAKGSPGARPLNTPDKMFIVTHAPPSCPEGGP